MDYRSRSRILAQGTPGAGPVVYWMSRDQRAHDNWALACAIKEANERGREAHVLFALSPGFLGATLRQYDFMLKGLEEVAHDLSHIGVGFHLVMGDPQETVPAWISGMDPALVVTDFSPLRPHREWRNALMKQCPDVPLTEVDAHNVVPAWVASEKREHAAYTMRPKIHKLAPGYLSLPTAVKPDMAARTPQPDWSAARASLSVRTDVLPVDIHPGHKAGMRHLHGFVTRRLERYALDRNDPAIERGQSGLSPYLHFGHIAPARAALEAVKEAGIPFADLLHAQKNKAKVDLDREPGLPESAAAFLEELVVRRELADNFCFYEPAYDTPASFSEWARRSLDKALSDARDYVYSESDLEHARTHDEAWNAAQNQMVRTGVMHGYMRMYWAKKILEWTKHYDDAMRIAIKLNDTYEIDGRDPNGYAGIAWSIGGVHDRPWFSRPVFGEIRYMNAAGLKRKFDLDAYVSSWGNVGLF
jgi:deoxyribodipyrimidine photo-lyase